MKVHKHDDSTRVTIPKEIIKARGWENQEYFTFLHGDDYEILLRPTSLSDPTSHKTLYNHGQLQTSKT